LNKINGVVFPVPSHVIARLLSKEKDAFAKFGRFLHLSEGQKLQFYDSRIHAIVGEATIRKVFYLTPGEVWTQYGPRLALSNDEFKRYVSDSPFGARGRTHKTMTLCLLSDPKKYSTPQKLSKKMNLIGHYIRG
jgi:hypothetical protein